jgi:hypothetical protein
VAEFINQLPPVFRERLLFLLPEGAQRQIYSDVYGV